MDNSEETMLPGWEYKIEGFDSYYGVEVESFLRKQGREGWELVSVTNPVMSMSRFTVVYYFKRRLVD